MKGEAKNNIYEFCKRCQWGTFDPKRGIICSLTNDKPDFDPTCDKFEMTDQARQELIAKKQYSINNYELINEEISEFSYEKDRKEYAAREIKMLLYKTIDLMYIEKKGSEETKRILQNIYDLEEEEANTLVKQIQEYYDIIEEKKGKNVLYGLLWFGGGILLTIFTYSNAMAMGGTYFIFYGAIIGGLAQAIRGLSMDTVGKLKEFFNNENFD